MIITKAVASDIDTILAWRRDLTAWLHARGEDQWSVPLPRHAVAATVAAGQTWMVWDGDDRAATITLAAWADFEGLWSARWSSDALWYPDDDPADALYAAKMMVPRSRAGDGLGEEMLAWAAGRSFDAGLTWLRLDAWTTNTRLHAYYERVGFTKVRVVDSRLSGACFQRPAQPYIDGRLKTLE